MKSKALPFPPNSDGTWHGLSREQLLANLKVAHANVIAWGDRPVGGFPGHDENDFELTRYVQAGINSALGVLFHVSHPGQPAPSLQDNLKAAG